MSSLPASVRSALPTSSLVPLSPGKERIRTEGFALISMAGPAKGFASLIDSPTLFAGTCDDSRDRFSVCLRALADENPTFGVTNGRFAAARPVLLLVQPDEAESMAATPFLRRKTRPARCKTEEAS